MGLGMWEILLIFLVVLLLFGAKRLPEIGSSLGKGIREFKGSIREIETELKTPETPRQSIHAPPVSGPGASTDRPAHSESSTRSKDEQGEPRTLRSTEQD
jgi:sec-independent protein translocase protein TatA